MLISFHFPSTKCTEHTKQLRYLHAYQCYSSSQSFYVVQVHHMYKTRIWILLLTLHPKTHLSKSKMSWPYYFKFIKNLEKVKG